MLKTSFALGSSRHQEELSPDASLIEGPAHEARIDTLPPFDWAGSDRPVREARPEAVTRGRPDERRGRRVDGPRVRPGSLDDTGAVLFLRRHGEFQECRLDHAAKRHCP